MITAKYTTEDGKEFYDPYEASIHEARLIRSKRNPAQELMFEAMRLASFNGFNGDRVVEALKSVPHLWEGCVMDSDGEEYLLRDISVGRWHADTLYILPKKGMDNELEDWVRNNLFADEIHWADKRSLRVLRLWWD